MNTLIPENAVNYCTDMAACAGSPDALEIHNLERVFDVPYPELFLLGLVELVGGHAQLTEKGSSFFTTLPSLAETR